MIVTHLAPNADGTHPTVPATVGRSRRTMIRMRRYTRRGLSLVEMLAALAISAMLLTATMVALDASFMAYADAAEQASTQAATRMITHRIVTLIRTSTAHGPLEADAGMTPPVTISGHKVTSHFIDVLDQNDNIIRIEHRVDDQQLWMIITPAAGGTAVEHPLIGGVTQCIFTSVRRMNDEGLFVLERTTMNLTVQPDDDATLALENGHAMPVRVIVSTMPRRLE